MTTDQAIATAMSRAFFASAWADLQEEKDVDDPTAVNLSGVETMSVMPDEIDPAANHAAFTLACDLRIQNDAPTLGDLYHRAVDVKELCRGDRTLTPEMFGHYLAMQAMGTSVCLHDAFGSAVYDAIKVPYVEFGSHSLQRDY